MKRHFNGDFENPPIRDPRVRTNQTQQPFCRKFIISSLESFNKNFPVFQLPRAIGFYSLDVDRNYCSDHSQLRYLAVSEDSTLWSSSKSCNVEFDLRKGIVNAVEKDEEVIQDKMLDDLFTWIIQERKIKNPNVVNVTDPLYQLNAEFVCFRGLLTLVIATPYERQEGWTIVASRYRNTIYMFQLKDLSRNWSQNPRNKEMALWGFKFEQYLCADKHGAEPTPDEKLNTNSEFCCILRTKLGGSSLLYGAEIDALKHDQGPPWETLHNFVELKTQRHIETERQYCNFRKYKAMKWWAQSFLVGIPTIVCGYRNDDGIVTRLGALDVNQLRKDCDEFWKANVCMNFCQRFLEFVKNTIPSNETPDVHYLFEYNPQQQVITATKDLARTKCSRDLIPSWYLDFISKPVVE